MPTTILPLLSGKKIDKLFGLGSMALITSECTVVMMPTRYNSVDNCVTISIEPPNDMADVRPDMPEAEQLEMLGELAEEVPDHCYLTKPMEERDAADAWRSAAEVLEAAAKACRGRVLEVQLAAKPKRVGKGKSS